MDPDEYLRINSDFVMGYFGVGLQELDTGKPNFEDNRLTLITRKLGADVKRNDGDFYDTLEVQIELTGRMNPESADWRSDLANLRPYGVFNLKGDRSLVYGMQVDLNTDRILISQAHQNLSGPIIEPFQVKRNSDLITGIKSLYDMLAKTRLSREEPSYHRSTSLH